MRIEPWKQGIKKSLSLLIKFQKGQHKLCWLVALALALTFTTLFPCAHRESHELYQLSNINIYGNNVMQTIKEWVPTLNQSQKQKTKILVLTPTNITLLFFHTTTTTNFAKSLPTNITWNIINKSQPNQLPNISKSCWHWYGIVVINNYNNRKHK